MHQGSAYARFHAAHLGVELSDLADIWLKDWNDHIDACRSYFGDREEFVLIDIDDASPADYKGIFEKWFDLHICPPLPDERVMEVREGYLRRLPDLIDEQPGDQTDHHPDHDDIVAEMVAFSRPDKVTFTSEGFGACSDVFAQIYLDPGEVRGRTQELLPIRKHNGKVFLSDVRGSKLTRVAGVANDLIKLHHTGTFAVDFQDSRMLGAEEGQGIGAPLLAYCRRPGAENVFLWPLPEYHSIGASGFPGPGSFKDTTRFDQKMDRIVWRGALSGHCSDVVAGEFRRPTQQVVKDVLHHPRKAERTDIYVAELRKNVRFRMTEDYIDHPDIDIALTPNPDGRAALKRLGFERLCKDFRKPSFFPRHKYVLSLRGFDTGSNFLSWANSNSVVMKEEDGWELFYSYLFKPWEHYIPLVPGAFDVLEKLEWARRNEGLVMQMTARAREACEVLSRPSIRKAYLEELSAIYLHETNQAELQACSAQAKGAAS